MSSLGKLGRRSCTLLLLALSGCIWVEDTQDLQQFVQEKSLSSSGKLRPIPEPPVVEVFVYRASSLRDPFKQPVLESDLPQAVVSEVELDTTREKELLETFALETLQMVGTISIAGNDLHALIKDVDGQVHRVQRGNFLGKDHGEIVRISRDRIEISEIISNGFGGWERRARTLHLDNN